MPKSSLRALSAAAIVAAIADAAQRWTDADFPPRVRAARAVETRLGYSAPVVDYALDRLFGALGRAALEATICAELGSLAALDGPVPQAVGTTAYARGVDRVVIVSSDTTIGVAIVPAIFALCAKCDVVVKDRDDALVGGFFASLCDERPEFAGAAIARTWRGGGNAPASELLEADVVVAFGSDLALRAIRDDVPIETRFVGFGHRASIGYVATIPLAQAARAELLDGIATDALLYDGEGCMSLHALFVAGDAPTVSDFVAELAGAFERVSIEFPAGVVDAGRLAAVAAYQNLGAFRAAAGTGAVYSVASRTAALAFDPPRDRPPPFLPRVLPVFAVDGPAAAIAYVRAHRLPLEALGAVDPSAPVVREMAEAVGAVRIARFGQLQAPPVGAHHGGAARISDFVRWIDAE